MGLKYRDLYSRCPGSAVLLIPAKTAGEIAMRFYMVLPGYSGCFDRISAGI